MSPLTLTGKQRHYLRALAHDLNPVIHVGHAGLSAGVVKELDNALESHELLKLKRLKECPLSTKDLAEAVVTSTGAAVAQVIGGIVVLYRPRSKEPTIVLPPATVGR